MKQARTNRPRGKAILVFGEDENDTNTIKELLLALLPDFVGQIRALRRPPVYAKGANATSVRGTVDRMCDLIRAEATTSQVVGVVVHRDCDALEPAHVADAEELRNAFAAAGFDVIPATPAWEMEAWLFLWPAAVKAYRVAWTGVEKYKGRNLGLIRNAKEEFRRAVRTKDGRDYRESDGPGIARKARELGVVAAVQARSDSFDRFHAEVKKSLP